MDLEWERENPRDNVIAGTVGAFLGSLIGVACIVILSKLGYVSAVSGLVMAVCAIKGYALLGGKLTKRGAVISGLFILVMTYVATKLCFALAVMEVATEEVSFFLIYQSIGLFLEDSELRRIFLGELALQYLFTLVGGIPTLISSLRKPVKRPEGPAEPDEQPPIQGEFYALRKDWMRPLRLSVFVPLLVIMAISVGGFIATAFIQETRWMTAIVLGGFICGVFLLCWSIPTLQLCNAFHILFVRAGGKLWRVDLQHFCSVQNWWSQSSSKQAAIKWDVLCEISCLRTTGAGHASMSPQTASGKSCGLARAIPTSAPSPAWNAPRGRRPPAGSSFPSPLRSQLRSSPESGHWICLSMSAQRGTGPRPRTPRRRGTHSRRSRAFPPGCRRRSRNMRCPRCGSR